MNPKYHIDSYDFSLPQEQIAQKPVSNRAESRLLSLDVSSRQINHLKFSSIVNLIGPNDVLVINDTKVFPARLLGKKTTGGNVELLLLEYPLANSAPEKTSDAFEYKVSGVQGLVKSSKRPKEGSRLLFGNSLEAIVEKLSDDGSVQVALLWNGNLDKVLKKYGIMPLPPYIRRKNGESKDSDLKRYQTVYARENGAIAAPTAGLHFTKDLLEKVKEKGAQVLSITLHVGYGTFAPIRVDDIRQHSIHSEWVCVTPRVAEGIESARKKGGKVWAIGTTSARTLEYASDGKGGVKAFSGNCDIYIYEGYKFNVVDTLVTNFHLPKSSLLFMVSAFAGKDLILKAYNDAVKKGYRFYSYGDAMVLQSA